MRMSRRMGIFSSQQRFSLPIYTGDYELYGDETKGYISLLTSGILTLSKGVYDIFAVGGGASGSSGISALAPGQGGGGSGYTVTRKNIKILSGEYSVEIGSGGVSADGNSTNSKSGGNTSVFLTSDTITANGGAKNTDTNRGGNGGSGGGSGDNAYSSNYYDGGDGGSDGNNGETKNQSGGYTGGVGQGTTTRAFGESSNTLYAGGGGGSSVYNRGTGGAGGLGGGGNGRSGSSSPAASGAKNTGGGGGGTTRGAVSGAGGSGIAMVRWGDWSEMVA